MSETVFVDTNVLVYARDASEVEKQPRAEEWMRHLWRGQKGRLSFQVLQEFYVTVTDKLDPGMDPGEARDEVRSLLAWRPVSTDQRVLEAAWRIQDRYRLAWLSRDEIRYLGRIVAQKIAGDISVFRHVSFL